MKVLGECPGGYICQIDKDDLLALFGETYSWGKEGIATLKELGIPMRTNYGNESPELVGATINIAGRFSRVIEIERNHRNLKNTGTTLRKLADLLDELGNAIIVPSGERT